MNIQSRWIPQGSRKVIIKGGDAIIYLSETNGVPYALAYYGKSSKPAWHHRFRTEEARAKCLMALSSPV